MERTEIVLAIVQKNRSDLEEKLCEVQDMLNADIDARQASPAEQDEENQLTSLLDDAGGAFGKDNRSLRDEVESVYESLLQAVPPKIDIQDLLLQYRTPDPKLYQSDIFSSPERILDPPSATIASSSTEEGNVQDEEFSICSAPVLSVISSQIQHSLDNLKKSS